MDHSRQKIEVGGKQGHAPHTKNFAPTKPHNEKNKQMAFGPRQLLNGQEMRRISGFKPEFHEIKFGTLSAGSLCERKIKVCEELRKRKLMCAASRKKNEKAKELVLWILRDEGINCGGQETMQNLEWLESW